MPRFERTQLVEKYRGMIARGEPIIGGGAGTGLSAKCEEAGGIDRMASRGSLAGLMRYGDANQIVVEMGTEVLTVVKNTPVLADVCGTDPFRLIDVCLDQLKVMGFPGVQNFPTVGLFDGTIRANLEENCPALVDAWSDAALKVRSDIVVLVHGGPVAQPEDAEFILNNTKNCHGFYGASSMERLPMEVALTEQTRKFKRIGRGETARSAPKRSLA